MISKGAVNIGKESFPKNSRFFIYAPVIPNSRKSLLTIPLFEGLKKNIHNISTESTTGSIFTAREESKIFSGGVEGFSKIQCR